jgi:hypothetical protein
LGETVKKVITAVAFTMVACSAAYATGLSETVMDPQVIAADTMATSNSTEAILALITILVIIMGAAGAF